MAVDLFSKASPRYSFSNDTTTLSGLAPTLSDQNELEPGIDFEFGVSGSFEQESTSADELFSQGMLIPTQIRQKGILNSKKPIDPQPAADQQELLLPITVAKEDVKEGKSLTCLESEEKPQSSKASFWSFKRSNSLNCDGECTKKGLLCSLQQGLARSNSTGSVPNPKKSLQNKDKVPNYSGKHPPLPKSSSTSSSTTSSNYYHSHLTPQHPKSYYGGNTYSPGGSRSNSILNVPPPYISNTNLFGLGSLFRNGKDKKTKK